MVCHVSECWGKPWTRSIGGPEPWYRKWVETSSSWMRSWAQSSKFESWADARWRRRAGRVKRWRSFMMGMWTTEHCVQAKCILKLFYIFVYVRHQYSFYYYSPVSSAS